MECLKLVAGKTNCVYYDNELDVATTAKPPPPPKPIIVTLLLFCMTVRHVEKFRYRATSYIYFPGGVELYRSWMYVKSHWFFKTVYSMVYIYTCIFKATEKLILLKLYDRVSFF